MLMAVKPKEGRLPLGLTLLPFAGMAAGAWFAWGVWEARSYNGLFVRGAFSIFGFFLAMSAFVVAFSMGAALLKAVLGFSGRSR